MIRLALWVCLVTVPSLAADADLARLLKGVEQRYNRTKTLKVLFTETYSVQGRARKSESGELTLRKPGRMRWDYTTPSGKLFVSDGHDVYLYTPDNNRVEKMKLKESEDMRAPLAFLLGKLYFDKEFRDLEGHPEGADTRVTGVPKTDNLPYSEVQFVVTPDYRIREVKITSLDRSITDFHFDQERLDPKLDEKLFQFQVPKGVDLVQEGQ